MKTQTLFWFLAITLAVQTAHHAEHVAQLYQIYVLAIRPPQAHGMLGSLFDLEWVHFVYNFGLELCLAALLVAYRRLRHSSPAAVSRAGLDWLVVAVLFQGYHTVEHIVKIIQYYLYPYHRSGEHPPPGLLPEVSGWAIFLVHFWFNMIVVTMIAVATWLLRPPRPRAAAPTPRGSRPFLRVAASLGLSAGLVAGGVLGYQQLQPRPAAGSSSALTDQHWVDVAAAAGLGFTHGAFQTGVTDDPVAAMGGGLCWIDYDNDGWQDLYLVNSHAVAERPHWEALTGLPRNALFRNDVGQFTQADAGADLALRGNGCVAADLNGDGWLDLYVTADGPDALLWNNADGTFTEGAQAAGLGAPEWNTAAAVADVNGDGLPDLFVAAYIDLSRKIPKPSGAFPQDYPGLADRLYLNLGLDARGHARFREVAAAAGLTHAERGLGALFGDLNQDGQLDLYVVNDGHPNRMYTSRDWPGGAAADPHGLGFRFDNITAEAGVGDTSSGMGVAGGDYDGDGYTDLIITNWQRELNSLYRNTSAETGRLDFQYSTFRIGMAGLGGGLTGWGTSLADFDHDTDTDLLVVNGYVPVTDLVADAQLVRLYRNRSWNSDGSVGLPGQFHDGTQPSGLTELGPLAARGSALADYDNDGDLDVAVNRIGGPAVMLQNQGDLGHWLQVSVAGFYPCARVVVELPDGRRLVRELYVGSSYLASEDPRLHFGLGRYSSVPRVTVIWPNELERVYEDVASGQVLVARPAP